MADMLLRTIQDLDEARGLLRSVGIALGLCYCHECAATAPAAMLTRIEALKRAEVERDGTRRLVAGHSTLTVSVPTEVEVEVEDTPDGSRVARVHATRHPSLVEIAALLRDEVRHG